jgi:hypothetical protein
MLKERGHDEVGTFALAMTRGQVNQLSASSIREKAIYVHPGTVLVFLSFSLPPVPPLVWWTMRSHPQFYPHFLCTLHLLTFLFSFPSRWPREHESQCHHLRHAYGRKPPSNPWSKASFHPTAVSLRILRVQALLWPSLLPEETWLADSVSFFFFLSTLPLHSPPFPSLPLPSPLFQPFPSPLRLDVYIGFSCYTYGIYLVRI